MSIGIVGLGCVGLPLAVAFAEDGCRVVGVELDAQKVNGIRAGRSHVEDIPEERLRGAALGEATLSLDLRGATRKLGIEGVVQL